MSKQVVELRVNGHKREVAIEPSSLLLEVLRCELGLTGAKHGCDESSCGACAVHVDGVAMFSCTMLAASCEGLEITTIEGLGKGRMTALQKAYGDCGGAQCGFCTPGFIMVVTSLLADKAELSDVDIRDALSSNFCRCTGYRQMYESIRSAFELERQARAQR